MHILSAYGRMNAVKREVQFVNAVLRATPRLVARSSCAFDGQLIVYCENFALIQVQAHRRRPIKPLQEINDCR